MPRIITNCAACGEKLKNDYMILTDDSVPGYPVFGWHASGACWDKDKEIIEELLAHHKGKVKFDPERIVKIAAKIAKRGPGRVYYRKQPSRYKYKA